MRIQSVWTAGLGFAQRLRSSASFRSAFFAFALTRAIVFGCLVLASSVQYQSPSTASQVEAKIYVRQHGMLQWLADAITAGDANWYIEIARDGYEKREFEKSKQHNWAFFPLYPLIVRLAAAATGEFSLTGALLSNLFFFAALITAHKTALLFGADQRTADLSVFYLAAFPASYFFSLPVTESLFLLLSVATFYCAKREQWWLVGLLGALASTTRLAGAFLWIPLALLYWQSYRRVRLDVLWFCLLPVGLIAHMLYLRSITGNVFAYFEIQSAWGRSATFLLQPIWTYVSNPWLLGTPWNFRVVNFASVMLAFGCGAVLIKRRKFALGLYPLISVIVPLSTGLEMQSMTRFMGVVFPIFFVLGEAGRSQRVNQIISAVFILLLGLLTAMFALRVTLAMA